MTDMEIVRLALFFGLISVGLFFDRLNIFLLRSKRIRALENRVAMLERGD